MRRPAAFPVSHGLWIYNDYQLLWLRKGTAPLTWNVLNAPCVLTSATVMFVALPRLKGFAQLLLIPLASAGAYMGHMGAGFPMYIAMNSLAATWLIEISGIVTVSLAMVIVWLCGIVIVSRLTDGLSSMP